MGCISVDRITLECYEDTGTTCAVVGNNTVGHSSTVNECKLVFVVVVVFVELFVFF